MSLLLGAAQKGVLLLFFFLITRQLRLYKQSWKLNGDWAACHCASLTVHQREQSCGSVSPLSEARWRRSSRGRRGRDAVGVRGEADKHHKALRWWSECECRSHTFNKGWCSLSQTHTHHTYSDTHVTTLKPQTYTHCTCGRDAHQKTDCI